MKFKYHQKQEERPNYEEVDELGQMHLSPCEVDWHPKTNYLNKLKTGPSLLLS